MAITMKEEFIDELIKDCKSADDIVGGSGGMVKELTKRLLERMLDAELTTMANIKFLKRRMKTVGMGTVQKRY